MQRSCFCPDSSSIQTRYTLLMTCGKGKTPHGFSCYILQNLLKMETVSRYLAKIRFDFIFTFASKILLFFPLAKQTQEKETEGEKETEKEKERNGHKLCKNPLSVVLSIFLV